MIALIRQYVFTLQKAREYADTLGTVDHVEELNELIADAMRVAREEEERN